MQFPLAEFYPYAENQFPQTRECPGSNAPKGCGK